MNVGLFKKKGSPAQSDSLTTTVITPQTGLRINEVSARRAAGQSNQAPLQSSRTYAQILWDNVFSFINGVFFFIALVLVLLNRWEDAVTVTLIISGGSAVNLFQEVRAKRKLDEIALLTRPAVTVIRDGRQQQIPPEEIVLGDLLLIKPGDQLVVDGQIMGDGRVDIDESLLTGEGDRISKMIP